MGNNDDLLGLRAADDKGAELGRVRGVHFADGDGCWYILVETSAGKLKSYTYEAVVIVR